jgi:hypothetical protein
MSAGFDDDIDADQAAIMGILAGFLARMYPLPHDALRLYLSDYTPAARAELNDRAAANDLWCHVWHGLKREFAGEAGFHFLKLGNLEVMNIRDAVVIRPKKVNRAGRHRNHDSDQQRAFDNQQDIPGLPPAAHRLIFGYELDPAYSSIVRVIVRRPKGRWIAQVNEPTAETRWTDITPAQLPLGGEGRAKKRG